MRRTLARSVGDYGREAVGGLAVSMAVLCWLGAVLGSLGCAGLQALCWLNNGYWPHWTNHLILERVGAAPPPVPWPWVEALIERFLDWPLWSGILLLGMGAAAITGALASKTMLRQNGGR